MITVSVHYHNMLRRGAGVAQETLSLADPISLREALVHLADAHKEGRLRCVA